MGHTPKALRRNRNAVERFDTPSAHRPVGAQGTVSPAQPLPLLSDGGAAADALATLYCRDDGWLRMVPQDHGKTVYWKWKFTRGRWAGHYIMWRDDEFHPSGSLVGLVAKLGAVDAGEHKPILDQYYGRD